MKYTVEFQMKPNGSFSITNIEARSKTEAELLARKDMTFQGYTPSSYKKIIVKELK